MRRNRENLRIDRRLPWLDARDHNRLRRRRAINWVTFNATTTAHISLGTPDDASRAKLARLIGGIAENTEQFFESDLPRRESHCYSCVSRLLAILEATDALDATGQSLRSAHCNGPITALGSLERVNYWWVAACDSRNIEQRANHGDSLPF